MEKLWDLGGLFPDYVKAKYPDIEEKMFEYLAKDPINIARVQKRAYDHCKLEEKLVLAIIKGGE